jgi:hypothetical protein
LFIPILTLSNKYFEQSSFETILHIWLALLIISNKSKNKTNFNYRFIYKQIKQFIYKDYYHYQELAKKHEENTHIPAKPIKPISKIKKYTYQWNHHNKTLLDKLFPWKLKGQSTMDKKATIQKTPKNSRKKNCSTSKVINTDIQFAKYK